MTTKTFPGITGQLAVTQKSQQLVNPKGDRIVLRITNTGTKNAYVGFDPNVSSASGDQLPASGQFGCVMALPTKGAVFVVTAPGDTTTVSFMEILDCEIGEELE